jgi:hypothetical protein
MIKASEMISQLQAVHFTKPVPTNMPIESQYEGKTDRHVNHKAQGRDGEFGPV